jgi:hypothetical protein
MPLIASFSRLGFRDVVRRHCGGGPAEHRHHLALDVAAPRARSGEVVGALRPTGAHVSASTAEVRYRVFVFERPDIAGVALSDRDSRETYKVAVVAAKSDGNACRPTRLHAVAGADGRSTERKLRRRCELTYLFISHDLRV